VIEGAGGAGATLSWSADLSESATFRVIALRAGRADVALKTAQGATTTAVAVSTVAPAIVIDRSEPLTGTVRLSIGNGVAYPLVEWFINLNRLGNVAGTAGNPINWNTESIASGEHLILARIQTATNSFVEVRRTVRVANVSLTARLEEPTAGEIQIIARAVSSAGIASVEATIDGTSLGKVTSPNCATCAAPSESYRWILDKSRYPSGNYAIRVTALDREGIETGQQGAAIGLYALKFNVGVLLLPREDRSTQIARRHRAVVPNDQRPGPALARRACVCDHAISVRVTTH